MTYEIKLPQFEGPFDLMLFFIERDELDIYDIPIAKITDDFLEYIRQMQELNIEVVSEFILVAATLMHIKAKMLIPRKEVDEEGNEIDPRQELVARLLEYKIYKEAAEEFKGLEDDRSKKFSRGNIQEELATIGEGISVEAELQNVTLYKLLRAFETATTRYKSELDRPKHRVIKYPYTIEEQKEYLLKTVRKEKKASFDTIFSKCRDRLEAIFTFLALLELLQQHLLGIKTGVGVNDFMVTSD
ncbi:MAG: segregation/condensation protein A [Bacteroidetes bacterium]|nr:segregation/condensation protein A [Bacteroidota bacterium]